MNAREKKTVNSDTHIEILNKCSRNYSNGVSYFNNHWLQRENEGSFCPRKGPSYLGVQNRDLINMA